MDPITKANHAKRLLEDDILKEAFAAVEKDIFEVIKNKKVYRPLNTIEQSIFDINNVRYGVTK